MNDTPLIPVRDPSEEPDDPSEAAARDFWDTHELTEEFLAKAGVQSDADRPPVELRDGSMLIRLPGDMSRRLRALAERRQTRPRALVQALLDERLAEEERRGA